MTSETTLTYQVFVAPIIASRQARRAASLLRPRNVPPQRAVMLRIPGQAWRRPWLRYSDNFRSFAAAEQHLRRNRSRKWKDER